MKNAGGDRYYLLLSSRYPNPLPKEVDDVATTSTFFVLNYRFN